MYLSDLPMVHRPVVVTFDLPWRATSKVRIRTTRTSGSMVQLNFLYSNLARLPLNLQRAMRILGCHGVSPVANAGALHSIRAIFASWRDTFISRMLYQPQRAFMFDRAYYVAARCSIFWQIKSLRVGHQFLKQFWNKNAAARCAQGQSLDILCSCGGRSIIGIVTTMWRALFKFSLLLRTSLLGMPIPCPCLPGVSPFQLRKL
ncbi:hypothetical protein BDZ97DRAFT_836471 [Flammula alnicola]|nr:hypothetical protein BDZ97DRAFT_836471 [Flammula alnicola]